MASFLPWYGKKRQRLMKIGRVFLDMLNSTSDESIVATAAEELRAAHIRALREKRQKFAPSEKNAGVLMEIEQAMALWTTLPTEQIVTGHRDVTRRRKMSSDVRRRL